MSGKAFSREFKLAALAQMESGETIARVARDFGVSRQTIYEWHDQLRQSEGMSSDQRSGAFERVSPLELPAELVRARDQPSKHQIVACNGGAIHTRHNLGRRLADLRSAAREVHLTPQQ